MQEYDDRPTGVIPPCPLTNSDLEQVAMRRRAIVEHGYSAIAVHSPWSPYAFNPGKQPVGTKWQNGHNSVRLEDVTAATSNTGILTTGLRIIEIDPLVPEIASAVTAVLAKLLPLDYAPLRVRDKFDNGENDSMAYLFRAADGAPEKQKIAGSRGAVEILGNGQQLVVDGYREPIPELPGTDRDRWSWCDDEAPWNVPLLSLPIVAEKVMNSALKRIVKLGLLGDPVGPRLGAPGARRGKLPATDRLRQLLVKHDGLLRQAIRELIQEVGIADTGRHDALVACAGALVHHRWPDADIIDLAGTNQQAFWYA